MEDVSFMKSGHLGADCFIYLFLFHKEIAPHPIMLYVCLCASILVIPKYHLLNVH